MILTQLKSYIDQHGRTSRSHLARQFGIAPDGVDAMLERWVKKGSLGKELIGCDKEACCQQAEEVWYRPLSKDELSVTVIEH